MIIAQAQHEDLVVTHDGERRFFWPPGARPGDWSGYRVPGEADRTRRTVDEVCPEELQNFGAGALAQLGRCGVGDLVRTMGRMLGIGRVSAEIDARLRGAIDGLVARGRAELKDGYVVAIAGGR